MQVQELLQWNEMVRSVNEIYSWSASYQEKALLSEKMKCTSSKGSQFIKCNQLSLLTIK